MNDLKQTLQNLGLNGTVDDSATTRELFSHDASMFEIMPEVVVAPKNSDDIQKLVKYVAANKSVNKNLSITVRSAGTCMSGGAINDSIILDMAKYMNNIIKASSSHASAQPGMFYRDFEKQTLKHNAIMPSYPASRELCSIGGMVANNAGGEKSLQFGKTERFVSNLKVIFADGNEYEVRPLNKLELGKKMAKEDFEGGIYREIYKLADKHYDEIKAAKPHVNKDSTGYHLWNVWDRQTGIFDLTQIITGSQGTLGIVTEVEFRLVPAPKHSGTLVIFLRDIKQLGEIINTVMKHNPATFEGFDNYTLMLSFKLFYYFHTTLGWLGMIKLAIQLIPDALMLFRGIPKMVLLVEFNGKNEAETVKKVHDLRVALKPFDSKETYEEDGREGSAKKFWIMRRESFNLLRKKVQDKHTAPFIDDLVVPTYNLPEFLPRLRKIINKYKLLATVAGHMGDGNFHVIPLMKIEAESERAKITPCLKEVNELVIRFDGSLSGEHNDGMSRGPWLNQMYSEKMMKHFRTVKKLFDPENIFNPHKKTDAEWDYSLSHIREHF